VLSFSHTCQGEIIGFSLSGYLCSTSTDITFAGIQIGGWPSAFYVFGIIGMVWTPFYAFAVYSSPDLHPHITPEEIDIIRNGEIMTPRHRIL
jgi:MFS family permease